jgi:Tat protein secretion system quality control protein TatD with DNase activity
MSKTARNHPAFLGWVVKALAETMNKSEEEIAQASTRNAKLVFNI